MHRSFFICSMLQAVFYTHQNFPIPSKLVFEKLLKLEEKLDGQSVKIKSIFNDKDNDPSMVIFLADDGMYRFKDFSTGKYGDYVDVAEHLFNLSRQDAFYKILEIFKDDTDIDYVVEGIVSKVTKEVTNYKTRRWNKLDEEYWKDYHIGGSFLHKYNVKPISEYTMTITKNGEAQHMVFPTPISYGYFNKYGELCKIYNPRNKKAKFLKVKEFIQGEEQLTYNRQCLIIAASLKDIGAFQSMKLKDFELIAPDSENVHIPVERIEYYRSQYKYIFTMFDNDIAGMKAMKEYKELYDIPYIYFTVENDMADCIKAHGPESTKLFFKPAFKNAIQKENKRINNKQ